MKLIVGLGNPGPKYLKNRHNLGFLLLDCIASKWGCNWKLEDRFKSEFVKHRLESGEFVILAKPQTFMNLSGEAVVLIRNYFKIELDDIFVVHDDLDLSFAEIKKQRNRGSAGHNGAQNIIDLLGTSDFWRLRFGVGRPENPQIKSEDWVLADFSNEELEKIHSLDVLPILIG